jgi:hypothetical protein
MRRGRPLACWPSVMARISDNIDWPSLKCRHGCDNPVGIFHMPGGFQFRTNDAKDHAPKRVRLERMYPIALSSRPYSGFFTFSRRFSD